MKMNNKGFVFFAVVLIAAISTVVAGSIILGVHHLAPALGR